MPDTAASRRFAPLVCRNIRLPHRRTSIRIEEPLWQALDAIAERENLTPHRLVRRVWERLQFIEAQRETEEDGGDPISLPLDGEKPRRRRPSGETAFTAVLRIFIVCYFQNAVRSLEGAGEASSSTQSLFAGTPFEIPRGSRTKAGTRRTEEAPHAGTAAG